jgi:hypothetical protein
MALTFNQQYQIATEAAFKNRVTMALAGFADDVMAENQGGMTGVDYNGRTEAQARTDLAAAVIRDAPGVANRLKFFLAAKGEALTIPPGTSIIDFIDSLPDSAFQTFMSANWSVLAGWRESDLV